MTTAPVALLLLVASGLSAPAEVGALLGRLGGADLVLTTDPRAAPPVRVLLATQVAAPVETVRRVVTTPASYGTAMPAFRRVAVVAQRKSTGGAVDLEVAWELEVPLWNLQGKLWLRPRPDGADLELAEGDFAPGLFRVTVHGEKAGKPPRALLVVEGHANVRDANVATRQLVQRSPLAETGMTLAAAYVMLKSLARLAETGAFSRPGAALAAPEPSSLAGAQTGGVAQARPPGAAVLAAVHSRADGRLGRVEVALPISPKAAKLLEGGPTLEIASSLPGWKKVAIASREPSVCTDPASPCWAVQSDLPLFLLDGIWKVRRRPWRARMVAGEREGALMGLDLASSPAPESSILVLSEHPRLDRAGYVARKLVAAEPYLEHGLALALTLVDAVSLRGAAEAR